MIRIKALKFTEDFYLACLLFVSFSAGHLSNCIWYKIHIFLIFFALQEFPLVVFSCNTPSSPMSNTADSELFSRDNFDYKVDLDLLMFHFKSCFQHITDQDNTLLGYIIQACVRKDGLPSVHTSRAVYVMRCVSRTYRAVIFFLLHI